MPNPEMEFLSAFMRDNRSGELVSDKYVVLCSSSYNELSYQGTFFNQYYVSHGIRFWTLGGGWNILTNSIEQLHADNNMDSIVSLNELYTYSYNNIVALNSTQHVVVYSNDSYFTIFARN